MTLYKKREKFSGMSIKIGIIFSKFGLSPNAWTGISLIPAIVAVWFLMQANFLVAALLFIVSAFIDLIDGSVARVTGRTSLLGAYLDTVVDRYVEAIIIFGLLFASLPALAIPATSIVIPASALIFLFFFGGLMTTYVKAAAKEKGLVEKELKGGLLERAERLMLLFVGILLAAVNPLYLTYMLFILVILTNISALQRIRIAAKNRIQ
ncbi:MAG: CDP-alcohol phosphatidyltransferase family protein [Nanoarchaeota archaeon]